MKKKMKDLSGDGKITKKDVLIGRGVIARKSGGMAKGSREGSVIKAKKGTHVTKDGRTVKKGLYYNMNKRKQSGTSRPGKGTVSAKALKQSAKTAFKPKRS
jgi:hypothetical protein